MNNNSPNKKIQNRQTTFNDFSVSQAYSDDEDDWTPPVLGEKKAAEEVSGAKKVLVFAPNDRLLTYPFYTQNKRVCKGGCGSAKTRITHISNRLNRCPLMSCCCLFCHIIIIIIIRSRASRVQRARNRNRLCLCGPTANRGASRTN